MNASQQGLSRVIRGRRCWAHAFLLLLALGSSMLVPHPTPARAQTGILTPVGDKGTKGKIAGWNRSTVVVAKIVWLSTATIRMGLKVMQDFQRISDDVASVNLNFRFGVGEQKLLAKMPALVTEVASDADLTRSAAFAKQLVEDPANAFFGEDQATALIVADAVQEAELAKAESSELLAHSRYLEAALENGSGVSSPGVPVANAAVRNTAALRSAAMRSATALMPVEYQFTAARAAAVPTTGAECRSPFPAAISVAPEVQTPRITTAALGAQAVSQARQARLDQQIGNIEAVTAAREARHQDRLGLLSIWNQLMPYGKGF